jgi:hypothetical protein
MVKPDLETFPISNRYVNIAKIGVDTEQMSVPTTI